MKRMIFGASLIFFGNCYTAHPHSVLIVGQSPCIADCARLSALKNCSAVQAQVDLELKKHAELVQQELTNNNYENSIASIISQYCLPRY